MRVIQQFIAFALGFFTGSIVGLLYAPERGTETRDKLSYQLDKYRSTIKNFIEDLAQGNLQLENNAKQKGEKVMQNAKEKAEALLGDVDALINKISN